MPKNHTQVAPRKAAILEKEPFTVNGTVIMIERNKTLKELLEEAKIGEDDPVKVIARGMTIYTGSSKDQDRLKTLDALITLKRREFPPAPARMLFPSSGRLGFEMYKDEKLGERKIERDLLVKMLLREKEVRLSEQVQEKMDHYLITNEEDEYSKLLEDIQKKGFEENLHILYLEFIFCFIKSDERVWVPRKRTRSFSLQTGTFHVPRGQRVAGDSLLQQVQQGKGRTLEGGRRSGGCGPLREGLQREDFSLFLLRAEKAGVGTWRRSSARGRCWLHFLTPIRRCTFLFWRDATKVRVQGIHFPLRLHHGGSCKGRVASRQPFFQINFPINKF